jgi:hypothetical protein
MRLNDLPIRAFVAHIAWTVFIAIVIHYVFSLYQILIPTFFGSLAYGGFREWMAKSFMRQLPVLGLFVLCSLFLTLGWKRWTLGYCVIVSLGIVWIHSCFTYLWPVSVFPEDISSAVGENAKKLLIPALAIQPALLLGFLIGRGILNMKARLKT